jgi:glycosyltransferase involved in cell wall biosynthesis
VSGSPLDRSHLVSADLFAHGDLESAAGSGGELRWPYVRPADASLPGMMPEGRPWPKISIVTPTFNQGHFIEETILSVANQGYPNLEHIVIDGGSKDETPAILQRYRKRLAYAVSEPDNGQSHAINKGFARATGDILTWLNSDDMLAPGALAAVAMAFATSNAEMIAGICVLHENGRVIGRHLTSCADGPLPLDEILDIEGAWLVGEFFYQPEVFFSRRVWQRAGGRVDESLYYSMDYELWLRFGEVGAVLHAVGRPLALYRVHAQQKTFQPTAFQDELKSVRADYLARTGRRGPPVPARVAADRRLRVVMINDIGEMYGAGIAHGRIGAGIRLAGHEVLSTNTRMHQMATKAEDGSVRTSLSHWLREARPDLAIVGNLHGADGDPALVSLIAEACQTLWILHDFWPLTGRCAYTGSCTKYRTGCDHSCPTPHEYPELDPADIAGAWSAKRSILLAQFAPTLLAYSASAAAFARSAVPADGARQAKVPNVEEFRLGVPVEVYRPQDRTACRRRLGLPLDRFIVLFSAASATEKRKGGEHLFEALRRLDDLPITCCVIGHWDGSIDLSGGDVRTLGFFDDPEQLATAYAAADIFVGPSLEETLGQVFIEAAACGTPVVGYPVIGVKDAIRDGITGRLASGVGAGPLETAIRELYADSQLRSRLAAYARLFIENEWSIEAAYRQLFLALQRLGILARLGVPRRIQFSPCAPPDNRLTPLQLWTQGEGVGDLEGPYPSLDVLTRFHWCCGPESRVTLTTEASGPYLFVIEYQNKWLSGQRLSIVIDGAPIGAYALSRTKANDTQVLPFRAELKMGHHELLMRFSRWMEPTTAEKRRLALMVNQIYFDRL